MATEPPGHGGRGVRSIALFTTAFAFLAGRACALASDAATTIRTQRTTTQCPTSQNYCLWALVPIGPGSRFAGCGAIDCMRWTKPLLDLNAPVERVHLPIFIPLFPREDTFCQGRSIFFSLFPSFPSSSLRPDRGQRDILLLFCLLARISLRIPWERRVQEDR
jgi:hypothetical protein